MEAPGLRILARGPGSRTIAQRGAATGGVTALRSSRQQGEQGLPALTHEDVVGPAGRMVGHGLEADAGLGEGSRQARMQEALLLAGADQDELGAELEQGGDIRGREFLEAADIPALDAAFGHEPQRRLVALAIDLDVALAVGRDGIEGGKTVSVEFHRTFRQTAN